MNFDFTKMHGCGNDYAYFFCFDREFPEPERLAIPLSNRHTGIGGDGIILILRSDVADAKMRVFNNDGSEGSMCGNGIRCVAKYLYDIGAVRKEHMLIEAKSGVRELFLTVENGLVSAVKVDMGRAELLPEKIPVNLPGESIIARPVTIGGAAFEITCVSMGNPHAVVFRENVADFPLRDVGPIFERNSMFPDRVNTEFVEVLGRNRLKMRVWERGSGETEACGTGACAAAVAAVLNGRCEKGADILVHLPGGDLTIRYTDETVYMTGGCVKVFDGTIDL